MNTDIKQAMHVEAAKSLNAAEANENERRWNETKIDRKNEDPTNHYDKARMKLNFEIGPDGKYIRWDIIRSLLMSDYRKDFLNLDGSHLSLTVRFSRIVVLDSYLAVTMIVHFRWLSAARL